jgi:hypothetical protein
MTPEELEQTILSQYANSPVILALIDAYNSAVDPSGNIDAFYNNIFNLETAVGYGLDVWGRILGVSRELEVDVTGTDYLGFLESDTQSDIAPFGSGVFYGGAPTTTNYSLTDAQYLPLLMAKALLNISSGSIPAYNAMLQTLFGSYGGAYIQQTGFTPMTVVFNFVPTALQQAIVQNSGAFQPPAGVALALSIP